MSIETKKLNQLKEWTILDLIKWSEKYLKSKNIPNSRKESEWFLSDIFNCDRLELYLQFDKVVGTQKLKIFKSYILRRINHEPFQYIINKAPFYGRDFYVNQNVLIPRPETETIIEIIKKQKKVDLVLDIGTGSGCLAITLNLESFSDNVVAIDNMQSALDIAKKNSKTFECKNIIFNCLDILKEIPLQKYDIVISNPPYISNEEINFLDKNIIDYEPLNSLTDTKDGLEFYKRFNDIFDNIVKPKGKLIVEFGGNHQVESLKTIFNSEKYNLIFHKDLNNNQRILEIFKK